jgi:hypothetical protein
MTHGRYERNGFHIRTVGDTHFEKWLAMIPQNVDPGFEERKQWDYDCHQRG